MLKAIVIREYGPPEVLRYEEVPDPIPGPGEVRIGVHAGDGQSRARRRRAARRSRRSAASCCR